MAERVETLAEGVTLYLGDCREILPTLGRFDVVVTDPPYGINYKSGHATKSLWVGGMGIKNDHSTDARDYMLHWAEMQKIPCLCFGSRKVDAPRGTRLILVWDKGPALGMGALDLPWKPSSEEIYVIGKGFCGPRDESNVLYCPPVQSMAKNGRRHPNEKPVQLLSRLLKKCPPGSVIDPFMGSASTGVSAVSLGRKFTGIEIEPKYFDIACRRISDALKRPDLFVAPPAPAKQESLL